MFLKWEKETLPGSPSDPGGNPNRRNKRFSPSFFFLKYSLYQILISEFTCAEDVRRNDWLDIPFLRTVMFLRRFMLLREFMFLRKVMQFVPPSLGMKIPTILRWFLHAQSSYLLNYHLDPGLQEYFHLSLSSHRPLYQ